MKFIRFYNPRYKISLGEPIPAKKEIPDWYKESESKYTNSSGNTHPGLKKCAPYLDALISGYFLVTPFDIFVKKRSDGFVDITWNGPSEYSNFIDERDKESGALMPRPAGHYPNHMVWHGYWGTKTPRGWSTLFTHPLNRFDLPFTTLSGIIDSDQYSSPGNIPFFIKEGFTGIIPEGTPFAQIIPIKRAHWKMINDQGLLDRETKEISRIRFPGNSYKNLMWKRKEYF